MINILYDKLLQTNKLLNSSYYLNLNLKAHCTFQSLPLFFLKDLLLIKILL